MPESSKDYSRSPSLASSAAADQEKLTMEMDELSGEGPSRKSTDLDYGKEEEEQDVLLPAGDSKPEEPAKSSSAAAVTWMVVNTLATIGIVCGFSKDPS